MSNVIGAIDTLWKTFGSDGIRRRAAFEVRKRLSRLPASGPAVPDTVLRSGARERCPFRPNRKRIANDADRGEAISRADRVLAGEYQAYRVTWRRRPALPDEWNMDLESARRYDRDAAWFHIPHTAAGTDIKDAWEPGRFAWAYDLARGWMLTGNDRYAQAFWTAFESFRAGCPPYRGVQWACGQE